MGFFVASILTAKGALAVTGSSRPLAFDVKNFTFWGAAVSAGLCH